MYRNVKMGVKSTLDFSDEFVCTLGVRQGECLFSFLSAMYINDLKGHLCIKGFDGIDTVYMKLFVLLYADDIVILSDSAINGLQ